MSRVPIGVQLLLAWLPVWGLYAVLIGPANPIHPGASIRESAIIALRSVALAALLGVLVKRLTDRVPWPHPFRVSFAFLHLAGAVLFAASWFVVTATVENLIRPGALHVYALMMGPNLVLGAWLYVMIAGTIYAGRATERAARAEAVALRSQLAALRSQLNPHFLFNALHTVVHLIPEQPDAAAGAAEQVAGLLRTAIEEDRDVVSLAEERDFVERYLALERLRFGDRLRVQMDISEAAAGAAVPTFALQALVENAVRHGAGPREASTEISVRAVVDSGQLVLTVTDTGAGTDQLPSIEERGTGLRRLRERIEALYGNRARLQVSSAPGAGFTSVLTLPVVEDA